MRYWLVGVIALAACSNEGSAPDVPPYIGDPISLDVVVVDSTVVVYPRGDIGDAPNCTYLASFPQPGACGGSTDSGSYDPSVRSCLTHVRFRGEEIDISAHQCDDIVFRTDGGGGDLEIDGCGGVWSATIPPGPYPSAHLTVMYVESDDHAQVATSWSSVEGTATYLVTLGFDFASSACHVTETQHVFDTSAMLPDNRASVSLLAFSPVVTNEQPTGTLRLWVGGNAQAPLRTPYPF